MEGTFEKMVQAEREAVSHDIVVRVLALLAQLRKMRMENRRLCRGLRRLSSGKFGISKEL